MQITKRLQALRAPVTAQVKQLADRLKHQGVKIYDFGVGEPDFSTPDHIKAAAARAMDQNHTKYTTVRGILELREAVAERYNRRYRTQFGPQNVVISCGAKQSLFNLMHALVEPGDKVLIPAPYWVSYPALVQLAQGQPVFIPLSEKNGFKLTAADIAPYLPKVQVLVLNSPCNPTGAVVEPEELEKITQLCAQHGVPILYDECYESFVYGTPHGNPIQWDQDNVFAVSSASKTYAMTGWRMGWAIGNKDVMAAGDRLQSQATGNPNSIAQWAAIEALKGDQTPVEAMRRTYERRKPLVLALLANIEGLSCQEPDGAFYAFPNVSAFFNEKVPDSAALSQYLLEQAHVAVVPGSAFGAEGHVRISYAVPDEDLQEGLSRMGAALELLI